MCTCAHTLSNTFTHWDNITARSFLAAHSHCACSEDALGNLSPSCSQKQLSSFSHTGQNVFVPPVPACCCSGFETGKEQAGWAAPLPHHPYCKEEKLSLAASSQPRNRSRSIFVYNMKDRKYGGNAQANKGVKSSYATATMALQQQHSNAQCYCSSHPCASCCSIGTGSTHTRFCGCSLT